MDSSDSSSSTKSGLQASLISKKVCCAMFFFNKNDIADQLDTLITFVFEAKNYFFHYECKDLVAYIYPYNR